MKGLILYQISSTSHNVLNRKTASRAVWEFHELLETDDNGNTNVSNYIKGGEWFKKWGMNWKWGEWDLDDWNFAYKITYYNQPYLLSSKAQ